MLKKASVALSFAFVPFLLASCSTFFTYYKEPEFAKESFFKGSSRYNGPLIEENYYLAFNDEKLNEIVKKALLNNISLKSSYLNVKKALLNIDLVSTDHNIDLSGSLSSSSSRRTDYHDHSVKRSSANFSASYQVDLFSKLEASDDAALQSFNATAYDYLSMRNTVIATTLKAYWNLAFARQALKIAKEDLADSETRLKLVENKYSAGAADSLDLDDAKINHLKVKKQLFSRVQNLKNASNALNVLLGNTVIERIETSNLEDSSIMDFSLSVPAKLLENRPDLKKNEANLRKMYALYNKAKMDFFPDFTLKASLSSGDTDTFFRFLENPVATLGAAITMPFLNFNSLNIKRKQALTDIQIAELTFVDGYINAVSEVYDNIAALDYCSRNLKISEESLTLAENNYRRYFERYQSGLVSLNDFITSADNKRTAKINYLEAKLSRLTKSVDLITALGGGTSMDIQGLINQ
ncbi:TolC family protein [Succinivibrio sp.]|uniref:TolC family protein n=1 Tax=Succinivibrio sp. TaxID=2053619 RepID=UPI0038691D2A